jgi:hypothetical protein
LLPAGRSSGKAASDEHHGIGQGALRTLLALVIAFLLSVVVVCPAVGCDARGAGSEPTSEASTARTGGAGATTTEGDSVVADGATGSATTSEDRPGRTTTSVTIGELGGRRNPIPVGREVQVGGWRVKVVSTTLNATQAVLEENMFNDPPAPDSQYLLVSIEAVYVGEKSSTFWMDMLYEFVGGRGTALKPSGAIAPDSILDSGEVLPGGSVAGNLLFAVTSDQIVGGTLMVEEAFARDDTRVFFAIR